MGKNTNVAERVKPEKAPKAEKAEKPPPPKRREFIEVAAELGEPLDGEGRLTQIPVTFDGSAHLSPKKTEFAEEHHFLDFKANEAEMRAAELVETAAKLRRQANDLRQYGDPAQRAKVKRATRLREQLAELEAALKAEGIEL